MSQPAGSKDEGRLIGLIATVLGLFMKVAGDDEPSAEGAGAGRRNKPPLGERLVAWLGILAAFVGVVGFRAPLYAGVAALAMYGYWSWRRERASGPYVAWFLGWGNLGYATFAVVSEGLRLPTGPTLAVTVVGGFGTAAAGTWWFRRRSVGRNRPPPPTVHMPGVTQNEDMFVRMLTETVPTVADLHAQFLIDYEGEELPYQFMEIYVGPWLAAQLRNGHPNADAAKVLAAMEASIPAYDSSGLPPDPAENLIITAFTEGVLREGIGAGERLLPPKLASWGAGWKQDAPE